METLHKLLLKKHLRKRNPETKHNETNFAENRQKTWNQHGMTKNIHTTERLKLERNKEPKTEEQQQT